MAAGAKAPLDAVSWPCRAQFPALGAQGAQRGAGEDAWAPAPRFLYWLGLAQVTVQSLRPIGWSHCLSPLGPLSTQLPFSSHHMAGAWASRSAADHDKTTGRLTSPGPLFHPAMAP